MLKDLLIICIIFGTLCAVSLIGMSYGNPLPLKADYSLELVGEMKEGEVTVWKLIDPHSRTVCFITVGELHGWTLSQTCLPLTPEGRSR